MIRTTRRQQRISDLRPVLGVFVLLEALAFLLGALLHAGVEIPIGGGMYLEHVVPATVVESVCSLVLAVGAVALITRNRRAWEASLSAHVIAIAGTILGIVAITAGRGEHNPSRAGRDGRGARASVDPHRSPRDPSRRGRARRSRLFWERPSEAVARSNSRARRSRGRTRRRRAGGRSRKTASASPAIRRRLRSSPRAPACASLRWRTSAD